MKIKIDFEITEKALVYAVARLPVVPEKITMEEVLKCVEVMYQQFGLFWTEHITSHQRYNLKPAWDAVRTVMPLNASSIDQLE